MKKKYYFQYWLDDVGPVFLIAEKDLYDREGCFDDDIFDDVDATLDSLGFCSVAETSYEYEGPVAEGKAKLLELGMIEKELS